MLMTCTMEEKERDELALTFNSIYLNQYSWDCGLLSAGGVLNVVDAVLQDSRAGLVVVRPPGHHAEQVNLSFRTPSSRPVLPTYTILPST